jgi:hypothetical protein
MAIENDQLWYNTFRLQYGRDGVSKLSSKKVVSYLWWKQQQPNQVEIFFENVRTYDTVCLHQSRK